MSTQQPPGGHEGAPGLSQPQDPWAGGYEPGLASVPTDPIPQQYDPYAQVGAADVWSQQTVQQGGQYGYVPQQQPKSRVGVIVFIVLAVIVLGGAGGYGAYYFTTQRTAGPGASTTPTVTSQPTTTTPERAAFDPIAVKVGDCLINHGTAKEPDLEVVACGTSKSYKVVKVAQGEDIPEGVNGTFDANTTSVQVCQGITYQTWYGYQNPQDHTKDAFFCMTNNP